MIALGIYYSDLVSTVSETYAKEILTPEYGEGLDPILKYREGQLHGIVNGIDYREFNPATDPNLPINYDFTSISRKREVKRALQTEVGLPADSEEPLLGYIGRFTRQKGDPILVEGVEGLLAKHGVQFVALGQAPKGEEKYEEVLRALELKHPQQVKVIARFDDPLAHRIYAGCDLFVMPSLYEPCGLGQLISSRYGTIPVVRHTGGLADTVLEHPVMGNGFVFQEADGSDLEKALERAFYLFQHKERWERTVVRAMNCDVSWERACQKYEELYQQAMQLHGQSS
jgi:starch synthase